MAIAALILLLALAADSPATPDPTALVAKLGSADPAEQAAATESLKSLGRDALPALEKAMKAKDTDLAKRASAVWDTVQRDLMVRPSLVRLDARNRFIDEVLEDIAEQTGMSLPFSTNQRHMRAVLHEPAPITFWTAIDRLGLKSVYQQSQEFGKFPNLEFRTEPNWEFTSISGPFHVVLTGLHWHHDRHLIGAPWVRLDRFRQRINAGSEDLESDRITYYGGLQLMVEPRVWFSLEGPARLTDATDDLGQSLVTDKPGLGTGMSDHENFVFRSANGVTQVITEFRLRPTERPGRVRGVVPRMRHLRRPEPTLVIALADAAGKSFGCDEVEITIEKVDNARNGTHVALSTRLNVEKADLPDHPDPWLVMSRLQVMGNHQIQLTDASGKVVAESMGGGGGHTKTPNVYRWNANTLQKGLATHLRFYGNVRVRTEAAFDFPNVPLP
jgi:hypothetical protein